LYKLKDKFIYHQLTWNILSLIDEYVVSCLEHLSKQDSENVEISILKELKFKDTLIIAKHDVGEYFGNPFSTNKRCSLILL
jgi:hypothetical protein